MAHLLDIKAAAARLGTTERHIRELIYRRAIPFVKVGRLVRFDTGDLDAWIASNRQPTRTGAADA